VTIYDDDPDREKMFRTPRYVLKDGLPIIEDHEFRADHEGRLFHVAPEYDSGIERVIEPFFDDYYSIQFRNYPVDDRYLHRAELVPTVQQAAEAARP